jgi:carbamate kinase
MSDRMVLLGPVLGRQRRHRVAWVFYVDAHGVEAVVDKDLTASLLARQLDADALLLLTDVAAVQDGYGTAQARPIRRATPGELRARSFPAGSMGPKIDAVCRFVEATGKLAAIGQLGDARALLTGEAGTLIAR